MGLTIGLHGVYFLNLFGIGTQIRLGV